MRAQQTRDRLVEEQKLRSKAEQEKVREAKQARELKMRVWREEMEEKLLKAEQLRESHLQEKRRKAQDEDTKVGWVSALGCFYPASLAGERDCVHQQSGGPEQEDPSASAAPGGLGGCGWSVMSVGEQGHEARLADMAEERARRREETVAREEAAQERRRALEDERKAKLRDLDERRRDQVSEERTSSLGWTAGYRWPRLSR